MKKKININSNIPKNKEVYHHFNNSSQKHQKSIKNLKIKRKQNIKIISIFI
jgi:hypothetical protein